MIKKFKESIKNPFLVSFLFLIFSIAFLSIFFNNISRKALTEQIVSRQSLVTRAGAKSIENFLNSVGRTVSALSIDPTQEALDNYVNSWKDDNVIGVIAF